MCGQRGDKKRSSKNNMGGCVYSDLTTLDCKALCSGLIVVGDVLNAGVQNNQQPTVVHE